ncbi:MAG: flagellar motor stator protein MotA [Alphaproteobacteria bacterium]|nr:flagellar motor stator protein MotA [Alphaproteobacteria bacterium]MCB9928760.1 flagellar motor stator protein MotA [Alphaproteobacteria bacterium]
MLPIIGVVVVLACVFGGYVLAGGHLEIILEAIPHEMLTIGGAAVGAYMIANGGTILKQTGKDFAKALKGPKWKKDDYTALLCLLFELVRLGRTNPMAIEAHVETPQESDIFKRYPKILHDHHATDLICDYLRAAGMSFDNPHQVDDIMERELEKHHEEVLATSGALQTMADGLPALGIVAAVMGVIKTMGAIDQPPEILGKMIGGALVGTFLGVFLSYGVVGPLASRIKAIHDEEARFYGLIRDVLVAYLNRHQPNICIEVGRKSVPGHIQPSFFEVENALDTLKSTATLAAAA